MEITIKELIHYKYVGGGYYRDNRVKKGDTAPMIHGGEIIEIIKTHVETFNDIKTQLTFTE